MMLRFSFALHEQASLLEAAVAQVLADGLRTGDIMQNGGQKKSALARWATQL